jgi:hypothetical protein
MAVATITAKPAAGPLTLTDDPDKAATTKPPMMPEMMPEKSGAPEASAMPRQSGKATRKTTRPAGTSSDRVAHGELGEGGGDGFVMSGNRGGDAKHAVM